MTSHASPAADVQPLDLQGLREQLLAPFDIVRDDMGGFSHPALPMTDEDVNFQLLLSAFRLETAFVSLQDTCDDEALQEAVSEGGGFGGWVPAPPEGEGWRLLSVYDTEDGPYALFARPAAVVHPITRREASKAVAEQRLKEMAGDLFASLQETTHLLSGLCGNSGQYQDEKIVIAKARAVLGKIDFA